MLACQCLCPALPWWKLVLKDQAPVAVASTQCVWFIIDLWMQHDTIHHKADLRSQILESSRLAT